MQVLETERLILSRLSLDDAAFVFELATEPAWLRFIGDRGIRDLETARGYLERGPLELYRRLGYGLYRVDLKADRAPIGLCGLVKRDTLPEADLGFAFLSRHHGRGYALEAAAATLTHGRRKLRLGRISAITDPENVRSIHLLEKLGFRYVETRQFTPDGAVSRYYVNDA